MSLELISAIAAIVGAVANATLVWVGYRQLRGLIRQIELSGIREKQARTLNALENYIRDPNVTQISKRIWDRSGGGVDYSGFSDVDHDVILSLNYLEGFATAVLQGVYDERMVRDFLEPLFFKSVKVFIRGESGDYMGTKWTAKSRMFTEQEYQNLTALFQKWWPSGAAITYKDLTGEA